ncbi:hypothetical protein ES319_A01G053600v1 [Gossypium barbadense]|uniref:Uncharacterized protein n=1 Tax=Gossypium barbadense TaxID=3634 RepID=A0A5J5WU47_GOSBA|nr:hypothetical protein ES319_A01G053600v1 [Gossypium barbadense]
MMALLLLHFVVSFSTKTTTNISTDQSALLALKAHIVSHPQKTLKTNWSTTTSICNWVGVTCGSRHQRVIALNLSSMLLTGTVLSYIGNLSFLTWLNMRNNNFHGFLSVQMANLHRLQFLSLGYNGFTGEIPNSFPKLQYLSVSSNNLAGEIPSNMFDHLPRLQQLYLEGNKLSGKIPLGLFKCKELEYISLADNRLEGILPKEIGNLTMLRNLYLDNNLFEGEIPSNMFDHLPRLQQLYLEGNKLSGKIPLGLFKCKELVFISLADNRLEGILPKEIGNLTMLTKLYLYNNLFEGESPSWFDSFPKLQYLFLSYNNLAGEIPSNMFDHLPRLQQLYLKGNKLSGKIPLGLFKCKELEDICFSSNRLEGILPKEIGNLTCKELEDISLAHNRLEGILPNEIGNLTTLKSLYLDNNLFEGVIPNQIGDLLNLEQLFLSNNLLKGHLPPFISNLTRLEYLFLSNNTLTGHIPITLGNLRYLKALDIANNDLSSTLSSSRSSFLSALANCSDLAYLSFARNPLISGYLPASIGNLSVSLLYFDASSCSISGRIPGEIGNWNPNNKLRYLALNENQLEGILPLSLINCSELVLLNVANNNLSDTFPHWLGMLPKLQALILRSNRFHGSIQVSSTTFSFSRLQMVDLSHNDFTGLLPTEFFQNLKALKEEVGHEYDLLSYSVLLTIKGLVLEFKIKALMPIFTSIDLSDNGFHGEIPKAVGELRMLHALNLSSNCLTGPIPTSFGKLTALESLDLSFNKLSGRIPSELTNLTFLEVLRLSNNNLIGPIPSGKQFDTFEDDSYLGNLGLCGLPLPKECNNDEIPEPAQDEKDHGNGISFIWKLAMMGYGCGMVLGISMAYIVFTTGRPWWLVRMIERDLRNKVSSWFGKKRK